MALAVDLSMWPRFLMLCFYTPLQKPHESCKHAAVLPHRKQDTPTPGGTSMGRHLTTRRRINGKQPRNVTTYPKTGACYFSHLNVLVGCSKCAAPAGLLRWHWPWFRPCGPALCCHSHSVKYTVPNGEQTSYQGQYMLSMQFAFKG